VESIKKEKGYRTVKWWGFFGDGGGRRRWGIKGWVRRTKERTNKHKWSESIGGCKLEHWTHICFSFRDKKAAAAAAKFDRPKKKEKKSHRHQNHPKSLCVQWFSVLRPPSLAPAGSIYIDLEISSSRTNEEITNEI
jgi:hypothetical protein